MRQPIFFGSTPFLSQSCVAFSFLIISLMVLISAMAFFLPSATFAQNSRARTIQSVQISSLWEIRGDELAPTTFAGSEPGLRVTSIEDSGVKGRSLKSSNSKLGVIFEPKVASEGGNSSGKSRDNSAELQLSRLTEVSMSSGPMTFSSRSTTFDGLGGIRGATNCQLNVENVEGKNRNHIVCARASRAVCAQVRFAEIGVGGNEPKKAKDFLPKKGTRSLDRYHSQNSVRRRRLEPERKLDRKSEVDGKSEVDWKSEVDVVNANVPTEARLRCTLELNRATRQLEIGELPQIKLARTGFDQESLSQTGRFSKECARYFYAMGLIAGRLGRHQPDFADTFLGTEKSGDLAVLRLALKAADGHDEKPLLGEGDVKTEALNKNKLYDLGQALIPDFDSKRSFESSSGQELNSALIRHYSTKFIQQPSSRSLALQLKALMNMVEDCHSFDLIPRAEGAGGGPSIPSDDRESLPVN